MLIDPHPSLFFLQPRTGTLSHPPRRSLCNLDLLSLSCETIPLVTTITIRLHRRRSASTPGLHNLTIHNDKVRTILSRLDHNIRQNEISPPRVLYHSYSTIRATFVKITSWSTWTKRFSSILPVIRNNAPVTISSATPIMIRVDGAHSATIRSCVR